MTLKKAGLVVPLLVLALANTAAVKAPTVADGVVCRETCFDLYMAELTNCKSKITISYPAVQFCQGQCDQRLRMCLVHCKHS
ncbi:hypothetical protein LSAT2_018874 [Lamellibrachia satsuma]|nr:hypothetical protein LSAT2_018874 [Lamellibrachia satsuma]